jgi:hypothetical protein
MDQIQPSRGRIPIQYLPPECPSPRLPSIAFPRPEVHSRVQRGRLMPLPFLFFWEVADFRAECVTFESVRLREAQFIPGVSPALPRPLYSPSLSSRTACTVLPTYDALLARCTEFNSSPKVPKLFEAAQFTSPKPTPPASRRPAASDTLAASEASHLIIHRRVAP